MRRGTTEVCLRRFTCQWAGLGGDSGTKESDSPTSEGCIPEGKRGGVGLCLASPSLCPTSVSEQRSPPDAATGGKSVFRVTGLVGEEGEAGYDAMKCVTSLHIPSLPCHMTVSYHMISFKAEGFLGVIPEMRQKVSRCQQGADEEERRVSSPSGQGTGLGVFSPRHTGTCCCRLCLSKTLTFCKSHRLSETQSPYLISLFHSIKCMFLPFFSHLFPVLSIISRKLAG